MHIFSILILVNHLVYEKICTNWGLCTNSGLTVLWHQMLHNYYFRCFVNTVWPEFYSYSLLLGILDKPITKRQSLVTIYHFSAYQHALLSKFWTFLRILNSEAHDHVEIINTLCTIFPAFIFLNRVFYSFLPPTCWSLIKRLHNFCSSIRKARTIFSRTALWLKTPEI